MVLTCNVNLSGAEFNSRFCSSETYWKLTTETGYRDGLNIDDEIGITFANYTKIPMHYKFGHTHIRKVNIPYDATITIFDDEFKTNKIILSEGQLITDNNDLCADILAYTIHVSPSYFIEQNSFQKIFYDSIVYKLYVSAASFLTTMETTDDLYKKILTKKGYMLALIKTPNLDLCKIAVTQDGNALKFVPDYLLTKEICVTAIKQNPLALQYVGAILQTTELCELAVKLDGNALKYVVTQTPQIRKIAVQQNSTAFKYIKL